MHSQISAISYYLPPMVVTNAMLCENQTALTPEMLLKKTGVSERRNIPIENLPSDFAVDSFTKFLKENPQVDKSKIDFLIYCCEGIDYRSPSTAAVLQTKLGLSKRTGSFDLSLSCSGYAYGILLAHSLIVSGQAKNVLFIAQGVPNWVIHKDDIEMRALFGDASSCTLITESETPRIGNFGYGTDGKGEFALRVRRSSCNEPLDGEWFAQQNCYLPYGKMEMNGLDIFSFSLEEVPILVQDVLKKNNLKDEDITLYVMHQASTFLLKSLQRKLRIPNEKFMILMEKTGNTVSASIPICLREAMDQKRIKKGDKVFIAGYGSGFSWCGTVITV